MRLVDADRIPWQQMHPCHDSLYATKADIDRLPTVELPLPRKAAFDGVLTDDVEPVRHGYWIPVTNVIHCDDEAWVQYQCSNCGRVLWVDHNAESLSDYPYCHCGAKMDLKENEK